MFAGLAVIYLNNRIPFTSMFGKDIPWPDAFYVIKQLVFELAHLSPQKYVALGFLLSLIFKYMLIDQQDTMDSDSATVQRSPSPTEHKGAKNGDAGENGRESVSSGARVLLADASTQTPEELDTPPKKGIFYLGTSNSSSTEDIHQASMSVESEEPSLPPSEPRSLETCLELYNSDTAGPSQLSDAEVELLVEGRHIQAYKLEEALEDPLRGVRVRREMIGRKLPDAAALHDLPYLHYNYKMVMGACCENVLG